MQYVQQKTTTWVRVSVFRVPKPETTCVLASCSVLCTLPQVPEGASGCVVVKLEPSTEAAQHLQLADVILEVEGTPIAADESVQFRDDERVDYSHVISLKHVGDNLNLKILRQGEVRTAAKIVNLQVVLRCPVVCMCVCHRRRLLGFC
jgi:S1-C subfamily serine protease